MLGAAKTGEDRVVFMGDSITQGWKLDEAFPGKPYVNRGISGQTTPQMLVRFRQDVIDLKPKVVVILAGTNDIAGNTGPMTLEQTEGNLASMAELAAANGIRVVLCSVLPAFDYHWAPGLTPAPKIAQVNAWLREYAAQKGYVYVDFYSAMKDDRGGLPTTLSRDGVHPLPAGFAVMSPLAEAGIEKESPSSVRPTSWTGTMWGWSSLARMRASMRNASASSERVIRSGFGTLMATGRSRSSSCAR